VVRLAGGSEENGARTGRLDGFPVDGDEAEIPVGLGAALENPGAHGCPGVDQKKCASAAAELSGVGKAGAISGDRSEEDGLGTPLDGGGDFIGAWVELSFGRFHPANLGEAFEELPVARSTERGSSELWTCGASAT
jgi:hypothetical protein